MSIFGMRICLLPFNVLSVVTYIIFENRKNNCLINVRFKYSLDVLPVNMGANFPVPINFICLDNNYKDKIYNKMSVIYKYFYL